MLCWTKKSDGWHSNGYRIECLAPHRWIVTDTAAPGPEAVQVERAPVAAATTFKGCKREAEILVAATRRVGVRRRHIPVVLFSASGALLGLDAAAPWNVAAVAAFSYLGVRSLAVILGTVAERREFKTADLHE